MTTELYRGADISTIDYIITEHFAVGEPVSLSLTLPRSLNLAEIADVRSYMESTGLDVRSAAMTSPNVLNITFARPSRPKGYAQLPLAVLIIGALGVVGIAGILGWQIASGLKSILDSIGKLILPLAVIVGVVILVKYGSSQKKTP